MQRCVAVVVAQPQKPLQQGPLLLFLLLLLLFLLLLLERPGRRRLLLLQLRCIRALTPKNGAEKRPQRMRVQVETRHVQRRVPKRP